MSHVPLLLLPLLPMSIPFYLFKCSCSLPLSWGTPKGPSILPLSAFSDFTPHVCQSAFTPHPVLKTLPSRRLSRCSSVLICAQATACSDQLSPWCTGLAGGRDGSGWILLRFCPGLWGIIFYGFLIRF